MSHKIIEADVMDGLKQIPDGAIQCVVTSPPYWGLRDYGVAGQIGLEPSIDEYLSKMVRVFAEVHRALRDDGTLWLNMGDSYTGSCKGAWAQEEKQKENYVPQPGGAVASMPKAPQGLKPKNLVGMPWRLALALQADGWYLRSDVIWAKPNAMPESVKDRPSLSHEYVFLLTKSARYFYDNEAVKEPLAESTIKRPETLEFKDTRPNVGGVNGKGSNDRRGAVNKQDAGHRRYNGFNDRWNDSDLPSVRNLRTVWTIPTQPFPDAHFATFPRALVERCLKAGTSQKGAVVSKTAPCIVLDPFCGSGTTGLVARRMGLHFVGIELNPEYANMARDRIEKDAPLFNRGVEV